MYGASIPFQPMGSDGMGLVGWDPNAGSPFDLGNQGAADLLKALTAGTDIAHPGTVTAGNSFALRPENLDPVLYNLTFRMEHIRAWPQLYKQEVGNVINEYNVLTQHGSGEAFFHLEGDLPGEDDSLWDRKYARVKCMGTTRRTSIMAQALNMAHMRAEAHQIAGGTMWMLQQLEYNLFFGDSSLVSVSFDGLGKMLTDGGAAVIDMRGNPLTGDYVNYGTGLVKGAPNYGLATDLFMPLEVFTDLADDVAPNARYAVPPEGYRQGIAGVPVKGWHSQNGIIRFQDDVFIPMGAAPSATAVGDAALRPSTPTVSVGIAAGAPGAGVTSKFLASDAGAYRYQVVAVNRYGRSAPLTISAGATSLTAGQVITFTVADGAVAGEHFVVYRSTKDGAATTNKEQFKIARAAATTAITDTNDWLPGCGRAWLIQANREFWKWNRLLKFMKVPLARISTADRFMLLIFGNLVVHAPLKAVEFRNVGRLARQFSYSA